MACVVAMWVGTLEGSPWVPDLQYITFFLPSLPFLLPHSSFPGIPARPPHRAALPPPQCIQFGVLYLFH